MLSSLSPRILRATASGLLLGACGYNPSAEETYDQGRFAIESVTIIDPGARSANAARITDQTVIVVGDRIERVGPSAEVSVPKGTRTIDGRGRFLIPGLWDMHVHPDDPEIWELLQPPAHLRDLFMPNFVAWGVTGIRDMGGDWQVIQDWRTRIDAGSLVGPRIVAAGPLVDGPEPSWLGSVAVDSPARGRAAVDSLLAEGVDFIKVYGQLPREAFFAVVTRAHERGVRVAGHVPDGVSLEEALEAGLDDQQHLLKMQRVFSDWPSIMAQLREIADTFPRERLRLEAARLAEANYDEEMARAYYRRMAESGIWATPTLVVWRRNAFYDPDDPTVVPWLRYVPAYLREWWTPEVNIHLRNATPESAEALRSYYRLWVRIAGELADEGVRLLAGSDTGGNPHLIPGLSLHEELDLLVGAGLTPLEALRTATLNPALYMGMDIELGTVEAGKLADLVLLDADPLTDIANSRSISAVVYRGTLLDRRARGALMDSMASAAR